MSDRLVLRVLQERVKAGVEIRVIGKVDKGLAGVETRKLSDLRLHVRAMVATARRRSSAARACASSSSTAGARSA